MNCLLFDAQKSKLWCIALFALCLICGFIGCSADEAARNTSPKDAGSSKLGSPQALMAQPAPVVLAPEAVALINEIDQTLADQYEKLHVIVLLDMQGEIMPCGCSDGVRGGLIKFASLATQLAQTNPPAIFVSLGGNHFRESLSAPQYQAFADYNSQRLQYVDRAIEALNPALKLMSERERVVLAELADSGIRERLESWMTLPSGTTVLLQGERPSDAQSTEHDLAPDWVIRFFPPEGVDDAATNVAGLVFAGHGNEATEQSAGRIAVLPRPEFGGRDLARLTLHIPKAHAMSEERQQTVRSIGEVQACRSIAQRSGGKENKLFASIRERWDRLRADAPVFYEYERVVVKLATPDDPGQLALYFEFQTSEQARLGNLDTLVDGDAYTAECSSCHAEIVEKFKAHDKHYVAMNILRQQGKDQDRFCVTCHTTPVFTGGKETQGFTLYEGVLCESCHINARSHAARPNTIKPFAVSEAVCVTCHTSMQDPSFQYRTDVQHVCCNVGKK